MNVNVNSTALFTVFGVTRGGNRVAVPAASAPTITAPKAANVSYDPITGKGSVTAPAGVGADTMTLVDPSGKVASGSVALAYVLDPNEVTSYQVIWS